MDDKSNTELQTGIYSYRPARLAPPNDALDIKNCGCYTTLRRDAFDTNVMKFIYHKVYYLCIHHLLIG